MIEKLTQARPYAKAIFNVAKSTGRFTEWGHTLKILAEISAHSEVQRILRDSTMTEESIAKLFLDIFPGSLNEEEKNLLQLLAHKRRLSLLPEIANAFDKFCEEAEKILPVSLQSVTPLTENQKQAFSKVLAKQFGKKIELDNQINPELLGGFWIKAGDIVIDGSILGRLEQLKTSMGE